jgi:hypothetical protein
MALGGVVLSFWAVLSPRGLITGLKRDQSSRLSISLGISVTFFGTEKTKRLGPDMRCSTGNDFGKSDSSGV